VAREALSAISDATSTAQRYAHEKLMLAIIGEEEIADVLRDIEVAENAMVADAITASLDQIDTEIVTIAGKLLARARARGTAGWEVADLLKDRIQGSGNGRRPSLRDRILAEAEKVHAGIAGRAQFLAKPKNLEAVLLGGIRSRNAQRANPRTVASPGRRARECTKRPPATRRNRSTARPRLRSASSRCVYSILAAPRRREQPSTPVPPGGAQRAGRREAGARERDGLPWAPGCAHGGSQHGGDGPAGGVRGERGSECAHEGRERPPGRVRDEAQHREPQARGRRRLRQRSRLHVHRGGRDQGRCVADPYRVARRDLARQRPRQGAEHAAGQRDGDRPAGPEAVKRRRGDQGMERDPFGERAGEARGHHQGGRFAPAQPDGESRGGARGADAGPEHLDPAGSHVGEPAPAGVRLDPGRRTDQDHAPASAVARDGRSARATAASVTALTVPLASASGTSPIATVMASMKTSTPA
jgi:hypothetical protein